MSKNGIPRILAVGDEPPPLQPDEPRPGRASKPKGKAGKRKRETVGRFQSINAFVDVSMRTLTPSERSVWLILWRDTKPNGLAQTSQTSIADRAGVSDRAVRKAIAGLQGKGLLTIVHRGGLRKGSTIYRVHPLAA